MEVPVRYKDFTIMGNCGLNLASNLSQAALAERIPLITERVSGPHEILIA